MGTGADVTAVLVTMGEPGTARALASVRDQTLPVRDVVVVDAVAPFSRALTVGVERVKTPFFVQVDSDMALDPTCVERLRRAMEPGIGIAAGLLRDPLIGELGAVKMFRRECFDSVRVPGTVAVDVDFYTRLVDHGWLTVYVVAGSGSHALGAHEPAYTPAYTYSTYFLLGCRYWWRRDLASLLWRIRALRRSTHRLSPLARVAIAHGLFGDETRDVAKESVTADRALLDGLASCADALPIETDGPAGGWYEHGRGLGAARDYRGLGARLAQLANEDLEPELAFCHGFAEAAEGTPAAGGVSGRLRDLR